MRPGPSGVGRGQSNIHSGLLGHAGSGGLTRNLLPGNSESHVSHSNVKIGRRPAHLPKVLMFSDKTLPSGWVRKLKQRKHGKQAGRWDVYIYSPCGVKFASRKKLISFFEKNNLNYDPEEFDFTPYGRHIDQQAQNRHLSSSSSEGSSSLTSPHGASPTSSFPRPRPLDTPSEFVVPNTPHPAHRSQSYPQDLHHRQQGYMSEFNPMMENPPNANALQVPQHQILNLSQPHNLALPSQPGTSQGTTTPTSTEHYPSDITSVLNNEEPDSRMRNYNIDLINRQQGVPMEHSDHQNSPDERTPILEGDERGERSGEDTRFLSRTYNLLTASQGDLGDMMEEYIYSE